MIEKITEGRLVIDDEDVTDAVHRFPPLKKNQEINHEYSLSNSVS